MPTLWHWGAKGAYSVALGSQGCLPCGTGEPGESTLWYWGANPVALGCHGCLPCGTKVLVVPTMWH